MAQPTITDFMQVYSSIIGDTINHRISYTSNLSVVYPAEQP
jgi:hypothetical protein